MNRLNLPKMKEHFFIMSSCLDETKTVFQSGHKALINLSVATTRRVLNPVRLDCRLYDLHIDGYEFLSPFYLVNIELNL